MLFGNGERWPSNEEREMDENSNAENSIDED